MARNSFFLLIICTCISLAGKAQERSITSSELLAGSIAFHDPNGQWPNLKMELVIDQELENGATRPSKVLIDNSKGIFELSSVSNNHLFTWKVNALDSTQAFMDFRAVTDSLAVDSLQLSPERARRWRNYYTYLYGLPMKLSDKGTRIDSVVTKTIFNGNEALAIKATYEESVGSDTWYFYFHPETYALVGYRFFHDEALNDGEYITLEGLEIQNGMRIPRDRYWFTNKEKRWLGTDKLVSIKLTRN